MMFAPADLVTVGIGRETTWGNPAATAAVLPVNAPQTRDTHTPLADVGWRQDASATHGLVAGPLASTISLTGPLLPDVIGWPLAGVLGTDTVSGSGLYTHLFTLLNSGNLQPASYTITGSDPVGPLAWCGCQFTDVTLTCPTGGVLTWAAGATGLSAVAGTAPTPPTANRQALQGWAGTVSINGVAAPQVVDFEVKIARQVTAKRNTTGTRAPYFQQAGLVTVTGTASLVLTSDTLRGDYTAGTIVAITGSWTAPGGQALIVQSTDCVLTSADRGYSGKWCDLSIAWTATANSTDAGSSGGAAPVRVTVKNNTGSGVYA